MSYDVYDQSNRLIELLQAKGYGVTHGNGYDSAPVGDTLPDADEGAEYDESIDGFWFTWSHQSGKTDVETGPTDSGELEAWTSAMEHFFEHAEIPLHTIEPEGKWAQNTCEGMHFEPANKEA
jgi:hypothetical protein